MGGLLVIGVVLGLFFLLLGELAAGRHHRAAGDAPPRRRARRVRRLPQRQDRRGHQRPPEDDLARRLRGRRRVPDPEHLRDRPDRGAVHWLRDDRPVGVRRVRGVRDHRGGQWREHHRRPRWPRRRDARVRVRRVRVRGAAQRADAAEPGRPVRADRRRAARLPVVQRPPGAGDHGRLGLAGARRDAGRDRAHHGPDPHPAARRARVRDRDGLGDPPGLRTSRRPAGSASSG